MLWSAGLCFFGLLFAALFHEHVIIWAESWSASPRMK